MLRFFLSISTEYLRATNATGFAPSRPPGAELTAAQVDALPSLPGTLLRHSARANLAHALNLMLSVSDRLRACDWGAATPSNGGAALGQGQGLLGGSGGGRGSGGNGGGNGGNGGGVLRGSGGTGSSRSGRGTHSKSGLSGVGGGGKRTASQNSVGVDGGLGSQHHSQPAAASNSGRLQGLHARLFTIDGDDEEESSFT